MQLDETSCVFIYYIIVSYYATEELLNFGTNVSVTGLARNGVYGFWQKGKWKKKINEFSILYTVYIIYIVCTYLCIYT